MFEKDRLTTPLTFKAFTPSSSTVSGRFSFILKTQPELFTWKLLEVGLPTMAVAEGKETWAMSLIIQGRKNKMSAGGRGDEAAQ